MSLWDSETGIEITNVMTDIIKHSNWQYCHTHCSLHVIWWYRQTYIYLSYITLKRSINRAQHFLISHKGNKWPVLNAYLLSSDLVWARHDPVRFCSVNRSGGVKSHVVHCGWPWLTLCSLSSGSKTHLLLTLAQLVISAHVTNQCITLYPWWYCRVLRVLQAFCPCLCSWPWALELLLLWVTRGNMIRDLFSTRSTSPLGAVQVVYSLWVSMHSSVPTL